MRTPGTHPSARRRRTPRPTPIPPSLPIGDYWGSDEVAVARLCPNCFAGCEVDSREHVGHEEPEVSIERGCCGRVEGADLGSVVGRRDHVFAVSRRGRTACRHGTPACARLPLSTPDAPTFWHRCVDRAGTRCGTSRTHTRRSLSRRVSCGRRTRKRSTGPHRHVCDRVHKSDVPESEIDHAAEHNGRRLRGVLYLTAPRLLPGDLVQRPQAAVGVEGVHVCPVGRDLSVLQVSPTEMGPQSTEPETASRANRSPPEPSVRSVTANTLPFTSSE